MTPLAERLKKAYEDGLGIEWAYEARWEAVAAEAREWAEEVVEARMERRVLASLDARNFMAEVVAALRSADSTPEPEPLAVGDLVTVPNVPDRTYVIRAIHDEEMATVQQVEGVQGGFGFGWMVVRPSDLRRAEG